jgi:hypothetical protein
VTPITFAFPRPSYRLTTKNASDLTMRIRQ